jgi:hypothetical protein
MLKQSAYNGQKINILEKIQEVESFAKQQSSKLKFDDVFYFPQIAKVSIYQKQKMEIWKHY